MIAVIDSNPCGLIFRDDWLDYITNLPNRTITDRIILPLRIDKQNINRNLSLNIKSIEDNKLHHE